MKISFLLFDEIEKASDALWHLLLGILDKATLTLGDNRRVDFSQTLIFMTSNLGASEMNSMLPPRWDSRVCENGAEPCRQCPGFEAAAREDRPRRRRGRATKILAGIHEPSR